MKEIPVLTFVLPSRSRARRYYCIITKIPCLLLYSNALVQDLTHFGEHILSEGFYSRCSCGCEFEFSNLLLKRWDPEELWYNLFSNIYLKTIAILQLISIVFDTVSRITYLKCNRCFDQTTTFESENVWALRSLSENFKLSTLRSLKEESEHWKLPLHFYKNNNPLIMMNREFFFVTISVLKVKYWLAWKRNIKIVHIWRTDKGRNWLFT